MPPEIPSYQTLDYRDLRAETATPLGKPDREIELRLTGDMRRYIWSFDDVKYADAEPIRVKLGEVVRFRYVNQTMMNHPIHIHGLWQYLDIGAGAYNPKSTLSTSGRGRLRWSTCRPMRWANGRFIAICCTTWIPACFVN